MAKIEVVEAVIGAEVGAVEEDFMAMPARRLTMLTIPMFLSIMIKLIASTIRSSNVSIKYGVIVRGNVANMTFCFPTQPLLLHRMVIEIQTALTVVPIGTSHRHPPVSLALRIHPGQQLLIKYMDSVFIPLVSYPNLAQLVHRLK